MNRDHCQAPPIDSGTGAVTGRPGFRYRPEQRSGIGTAPSAWQHVSALELAPLPAAIPCFRLHATAVFREWGLPRSVIEDGEMLVSELMTNAVDASIVLPDRPPVTLRLRADEKSLLIEAWDQSPLDLAPQQSDAGAECGRGLIVVAALSSRWGQERTGRTRKVVWAQLAL